MPRLKKRKPSDEESRCSWEESKREEQQVDSIGVHEVSSLVTNSLTEQGP